MRKLIVLLIGTFIALCSCDFDIFDCTYKNCPNCGYAYDNKLQFCPRCVNNNTDIGFDLFFTNSWWYPESNYVIEGYTLKSMYFSDKRCIIELGKEKSSPDHYVYDFSYYYDDGKLTIFTKDKLEFGIIYKGLPSTRTFACYDGKSYVMRYVIGSYEPLCPSTLVGTWEIDKSHDKDFLNSIGFIPRRVTFNACTSIGEDGACEVLCIERNGRSKTRHMIYSCVNKSIKFYCESEDVSIGFTYVSYDTSKKVLKVQDSFGIYEWKKK